MSSSRYAADDYPKGAVPVGTYAQQQRAPIVWVRLCAGCGGFAPFTDDDYAGYLSGTCQGCARRSRELHLFRAYIDSASGCNEDRCAGRHATSTNGPMVGDMGGRSR